MKQIDIDLLLARAQVIFAFLMLVGIFALVFVLIFYHGQMTTTGVTIITSVITALVTILTLQMNFFYARTRPPALPDPNLLPPSAPTLSLTTNGDPNAPTVAAPAAPSAKPTV